MTTEHTTRTPVRKSRAVLYAFIVIAATGGVYVGTRWHAAFAPLIGMNQVTSAKGGDAKDEQTHSKQLWTCGMHPQVIQDHPGDCPICHMKLTPLKETPSAHGFTPMHPDTSTAQSAPGADAMSRVPDGQNTERKIKYWWDPMLSPPYISDKPGKSPMGMDLIPVYEDEATSSVAAGQVTIDPSVVQNMGVRVAIVTEGPLAKLLRLVGYLDEAQPNIREINLRVSGWIRRLYANTEGQHIEAGDPLFDLYSPELQVSIEELINGRRAKSALAADSDEFAKLTATTLYDAAADKLELLGLERTQIEGLAKLAKAPPTVTFVSPITGHITEKPVVEGAAVKAGDRVLKIVDHSTLWLDAQVFEKDLPFVKVGDTVLATIASRPGEPITGEIIFIHPHVDMATRTALVRMAIPNPSLEMKPGMYATVHARADIAERAVMVPREAIIDTGDTQLTFVVRSLGTFEPRKVTMGLAGENGMVQVLRGLTPGEVVVTSGQFLLDSESRLREAIQKYLSQKQLLSSTHAPTTDHRDYAATGEGSTMGAVQLNRAAEESPARIQKLDSVVVAYLDISAALGAEQTSNTSVDMATLVRNAHALRDDALGTKVEPLTIDVAQAAEAMRSRPIEQQRELFKRLSESMIALVDELPPSRALGDELFVMQCPMAPGSWIQRSKDVANPFYATEMKSCGSLLKPVRARGDKP